MNREKSRVWLLVIGGLLMFLHSIIGMQLEPLPLLQLQSLRSICVLVLVATHQHLTNNKADLRQHKHKKVILIGSLVSLGYIYIYLLCIRMLPLYCALLLVNLTLPFTNNVPTLSKLLCLVGVIGVYIGD